jgi:hypothetical protein
MVREKRPQISPCVRHAPTLPGSLRGIYSVCRRPVVLTWRASRINVRSGKHSSQHHAAQDVKWNPLGKEVVATASPTGAVVLWHLDRLQVRTRGASAFSATVACSFVQTVQTTAGAPNNRSVHPGV